MNITPRPYQTDALNAIKEGFESVPNLLLVHPTGSGKTVTCAMLFDELLTEGAGMFIVDQIELAFQAQARFTEFIPHIKVGIEMAEHRADPDCDIFIVSADTLGRKKSKRIHKRFNELRNKIKLVVVDEGHKSVVPKFIRILEYIGVGKENFDPDKRLLAVTATPNRTDGVGLKHLYSDVAHEYELHDAVRDGWLVDFELVKIETGTDISTAEQYKSGQKKGEYKDDSLAPLINTPERNALVVKTYKEYCDGDKAFVYAGSVDHAYELEQTFEDYGINSFVIEANTDKVLRRQKMDDFQNGYELNVLINYSTLSVGVDSTELKALLLTRPIGSELLYRQIIGRGARPCEASMIDLGYTPDQRKLQIENSEKPSCLLIDFADVTDKQRMTPTSLFGLNPDLKVKPKTKLFKEVIEPLEEIQREHNVDIRSVVDLDSIQVIEKKRTVGLPSLKTPKGIKHYTDKSWLMQHDNSYELNFSKEGVALNIRENLAGKWEVFKVDTKTGVSHMIGKFGSQSGAFTNADEYANNHFDTTFRNTKAGWRRKGVSEPQYNKLVQFENLLDQPLHVDDQLFYSDSGVPKMYYKGELLTRGSAGELLDRIFTLLKNNSHDSDKKARRSDKKARRIVSTVYSNEDRRTS